MTKNPGVGSSSSVALIGKYRQTDIVAICVLIDGGLCMTLTHSLTHSLTHCMTLLNTTAWINHFSLVELRLLVGVATTSSESYFLVEV